MAISQPVATDKLNSPSHSLSHRVIANDPLASAQTVVVDASSNTKIGGTTGANFAQFTPTGGLSFEGTAGLLIPYMQQSDGTDQNIVNTTLAQVITFSDSDHLDLITRTSSSRFTFPKTGSYLFSFSGVAQGLLNETIDVWIRVNGTDVPRSNTSYTFKSNGGQAVIAFTFIQNFTAGQYIEFWTSGSNTGCLWNATAAGTGPTRPATPSIILTCNYIAID